jgi:outer membrane protein assembly factor BamB
MRIRHKTRLATIMATAAALVAATAATAVGAGTTAEWPAYEGSPLHHSQRIDTTITAANAGHLHAAWHFTAAAATQQGQPARGFDASPIIMNNRIYIGSRTGMFYALNATTGAVVWKKQLDFGSTTSCPARGIIGTATVAPDPVTKALTVYAPGSHFIYALNAANGVQKWKTAIGPNTATGEALYFNWSSPTVAGGRIFTGLGANCTHIQIRAGVVSLNQHTGATQHTYFDVPAGKVGATVWSSQAVIGSDVFVSTGNPDPNGTTLDDAYSIVHLLAGTLAKVDKYTLVHGQAADLDFGSSPTLFTGTVGGVSTPLLAACNKDGSLRAWRQADLAAGPIWTDVLGATASPTNGECISSPAYDANAGRLFMAANQTTIGGVLVHGSVRAINPSTGAFIWERAMPCGDVGSVTDNGAIIAVPMFTCPTGTVPSIQLVQASNGASVGSIPIADKARVFAQPVFAEGELLVADEGGTLTAYRP